MKETRTLTRTRFKPGSAARGSRRCRGATSRRAFRATQRVYSTGLRYDNDNRDGATLDAARFTEVGWRVDASFSPVDTFCPRVRW